MNHQELARKLIENDSDSRARLIKEYSRLADARLAAVFQQICYEVWTHEPQKISRIVEILRQLSDFTGNAEIRAYAEWTTAIENLVNGRLEETLQRLDESEKRFRDLKKFHAAATTQISKLYALALLGRYDEAVACGLRARDVFVAENDLYSVGKIEHNIGNLYWRRDFYRESEPYLASAHRHFEQIGDQRQLAMVENCQAFVAALQNNFRAAESVYERALKRSAENNLVVTEAEIETGMSNLYLFQGRLDLALKFMERSRRKYDSLGMPHQSANCELEIADIYLELNLLPEAVAFYEKTEAKFAGLGMQAELARSLLSHAKALFLLGETEQAANLLDRAEKLFAAEGNSIAVAQARLSKAQFYLRENDFAAAQLQAEPALREFVAGGNRRHELLARWLLGEIFFRRGEKGKAETIFRETLSVAEADDARQIEYLCLVGLGKISGDEKFFLEAINLVENSRSALSAEEFRTAFFSDKLLPYNELVKIKIAQNNFAEALSWHERSRSRSLLETMNGAAKNPARNPKIEELRKELNWFYSRINRRTASGLEARRGISELQKLAAEKERELAELERRSRIGEKTNSAREIEKFDLKKLQNILNETTVVEFACFDESLRAFVITGENFEVFRYSFKPEKLRADTRQFLFQIKTGRFLENLSTENQRLATERLMRHAQAIYDALVRPLEKFFAGGRLVVVPTDFLHSLPFQALHDGEKFLIEGSEIVYAPSLAVLQSCLSRKISPPESALLVGVSDAATPLIDAEIETLAPLFKASVRLKNEAATLENLRKNLAERNVLHLACHGKFRLDNPDFSALNLFAENLTVGDARGLPLQDKLVVLSACETGLNKIVSGEELFGLTRGFLHAGASALVSSLWTVNDRSTADLMRRFYGALLKDTSPAKALQIAQIQLLAKNAHPYFWSPFVFVGHW
ncbi:MAG TPA: CHAT domain-containing protein [Pyrinomonadaceae bacterium]